MLAAPIGEATPLNTTTPKRQRTRGVAPANWQFRDGRPRWIPSRTLREAGWRGRDLKAPKSGDWLSRGLSIDMAEAINQAVAAWRRGELVPDAFADIAPQGATAKPRMTTAQRLERHSIGTLIDEYLASHEVQELKPRTQAEYKSKLKRLADALAGYFATPSRNPKPAEKAAYDEKVATVRAWSVKVLQTPEEEEDGEALLYTVYWGLRKKAGAHTADGVLRVTSSWLEWCRTQKRAIRTNPTQDVKRKALDGRMRPASWPELLALVEAAEGLGYPSIADSIILGVDLSWSQADRLALTWKQVSAAYRVRARRVKTNRPGETPLLDALGKPRIDKIRERQKGLYGENVKPTHVLICETTGEPWGASHYQVTFAEIRRQAARKVASAIEVLDKDLRCTAVTVAYDAGLSEVQIAGRTLHSLKQIREILDGHYGQIGREVSNQGAHLLNTYLAEKGYKL